VTDDLAFAFPLPHDLDGLDYLLTDVGAQVLPTRFPPPIGGADIFGDIWDTIKQFGSFLSYPGQIMGWLWDKISVYLWNRVGDVGNFFWTYLINPTLRWVYDRVWDVSQWFWQTAISPALNWVWNRVWDVSQWFWATAISPALNWVYNRVWDVAQWFWATAIKPAFDWTWATVSAKLDWLWATAIKPAFDWTWATVSAKLDWLNDSVLSPAFDWIGDRLGDIKDFGEATHDVVVNQVWPTVQSIPEHVVSVGIAGAQAIGGGFRDALEWLFNHVFDPIADAIAVKISIPRKLATGQYRTVEELLDDFEDPVSPGSIAGLLVGLLGAVVGLVPALMDVGRIEFQETTQYVAKQVGLTIPTFADLRDALLRDLMSEEKHDDWLGRAGFSQANIDIIKELYFDIPTPSDLVRMAVREAFTPAVIERFGLHEDFPADFARYGRQTGISEMWAKAHWAAHWDLPSPTQGFEMYHRGVIERPDLELLLRTLDVMPFWRGRLIDIAYRVISRIDVRRMYRNGVIDRAKVLRVYLDLGYTPEDAELLTLFVEKDAAGTGKDLSRETIISLYRDRLLSLDETRQQLRALGFGDEDVEILIAHADVAVERANAALAEDIVEADFKAGAISEAAARSQLADLEIPPLRIELLIRRWSQQRTVRTATLTMSQDLRLFKEGIINETQLRAFLTALGYQDPDLGLLVKLATPESSAPEARELTKADLRAAFRAGLLPQPEVRTRLASQGYSPADADMLIQLWKPTPVEADLTRADLHAALTTGVLRDDEVHAGLVRLGYDTEEAGTIIKVWTPPPETADLTKGDLRAAFRAGTLNEIQVRDALASRGYSADEVEVLLDTWRPAPVV